MGRKPLSETEKTVATTIRLPADLLAVVLGHVSNRGMSRFFREAAEAKLVAEGIERAAPKPPKP